MFKPNHKYTFFKIYARKMAMQYLGNENYIDYMNLMSDKSGWTETPPRYKRDLKETVRWLMENLYYSRNNNELKEMLNEIDKIINKYTDKLYSKYGDRIGKVQDN